MRIKVGNKVLKEISVDEIKALKHDLLSPKDWFQAGPLENKIIQSKKRMFRQWIPILRERGLTIPSNDADLVALILSQPDYKNRKQREEVDKDVVEICVDSNKKSKPSCPLVKTRTLIFEKGEGPTVSCDVH